MQSIVREKFQPMVNDLHEKLKKMSLDNLNLIHQNSAILELLKEAKS